MLVVVETRNEFSDSRKFYLRPGERARVGRTEWADWALPRDLRMADVHFLVNCEADGCRLEDLSGGETTLNREPVSESRLKTGDLIFAGGTTFVVEIEGEPTPISLPSFAVEESSEPATTTVNAPIAEIATWAELDAAALAVVSEKRTLADAVAALVDSASPVKKNEPRANRPGLASPPADNVERLKSALRLLAFAFTSPHGVRWACDAVTAIHGEALPATDRAALDAARLWIDDRSCHNRGNAMSAAESAGMRSAAAWVAVAAAWSGGPSMDDSQDDDAPCDHPEFRLDHHRLSAKALAGALTLAGVEHEPHRAAEHYRQMIELGLEFV